MWNRIWPLRVMMAILCLAVVPALDAAESPDAGAAAKTVLVAQEVASKKDPQVVAPAIWWDNGKGNGRRASRGVLVELDTKWKEAGSKWQFDWQGNDSPIVIVHPYLDAHFAITLSKGGIAASGANTIERKLLKSFHDGKPHRIVSILAVSGAYRLTVDDGTIVDETITAAAPFPLPASAKPRTQGFVILSPLPAGTAAVITEAVDDGINQANKILIGPGVQKFSTLDEIPAWADGARLAIDRIVSGKGKEPQAAATCPKPITSVLANLRKDAATARAALVANAPVLKKAGRIQSIDGDAIILLRDLAGGIDGLVVKNPDGTILSKGSAAIPDGESYDGVIAKSPGKPDACLKGQSISLPKGYEGGSVQLLIRKKITDLALADLLDLCRTDGLKLDKAGEKSLEQLAALQTRHRQWQNSPRAKPDPSQLGTDPLESILYYAATLKE